MNFAHTADTPCPPSRYDLIFGPGGIRVDDNDVEWCCHASPHIDDTDVEAQLDEAEDSPEPVASEEDIDALPKNERAAARKEARQAERREERRIERVEERRESRAKSRHEGRRDTRRKFRDDEGQLVDVDGIHWNVDDLEAAGTELDEQ